MMRRIAYLVAAAGAAACTLTACGGPSGTSDTPDQKPAGTISTAMKQQGHAVEASVASERTATFTRVPAAFLGRWRIYQVDGGGPHAVQFSVGVGPDRVVLLTGNGPAFGLMAEAAGARIRTAAQAATLARVYLRTTRPTDVLSYTVEDAGRIHFRPNLSGADAAHRDAIVRKYRPVIAPPRAEPASGGFTVTAYIVRDRALQRRTLNVSRTGMVRDDAKTLVNDLPVPYTM